VVTERRADGRVSITVSRWQIHSTHWPAAAATVVPLLCWSVSTLCNYLASVSSPVHFVSLL